MIPSVIPLLRCPGCAHSPLGGDDGGIECDACGARYPVRDGILDMSPPGMKEVITPFQRVMQTRWVVSVYERLWRQAGYLLASSRPFARELETVLRFRSGRDSSRILDVACGTGVFTRPLARSSGGFVIGFDLSWPMLRFAERRARDEALQNLMFIRGTVFRLPFIASSFPYVNCCGALHLFEDPGRALLEISRVVAREGLLAAQTTIRPEHSAGIAWFLERWIRFGFFKEDDLREMLRLSRLAVLYAERHRISFTFLAQRKS